MATTDVVFAAFVRCETKAYLLREAPGGHYSDPNSWRFRENRSFKQSAATWIRSTVREHECHEGTPSFRVLEQGLYRIILDPLMASRDICSQPDALLRMRSASDASGALYSPVRFVSSEKPSTADKLMLA